MMSEEESPFWQFFNKLGLLPIESLLEPGGVTLFPALDPLEISDFRL